MQKGINYLMKKMTSILCLAAFLALFSFSSTITAEKFFNIKDYGAIAGDKGGATQALLKAWADACATKGPTRVVIPHARYNLKQVVLAGPCQGHMTLQIKGTLVAPSNPKDIKADGWLKFTHLDGLTILNGTLDGQGKAAWTTQNCGTHASCPNFPMNLRLDWVQNALIESLVSKDSKNFHINLISTVNVTLNHVTISAPGDSPNTDGIHLARSSKVKILSTKIGTGDDCISIGDGSQDITVKGVTCGPGHGISIGSLGKFDNEAPVKGVRISKCTLENTTNGIRIKSWPGMKKGAASDIHFTDINMKNVSFPVLIDQLYCPWGNCKSGTTSNVKISDVTFENIHGTSATPTIVKLACSKHLPCENVNVNGVTVTYSGNLGPAKSECTNVQAHITGRTESLRGC